MDESREDCLREASECDRLANLANTRALAPCWRWLRSNGANSRIKPPNGKRPIGHRCRKRSVQTSAGRT